MGGNGQANYGFFGPDPYSIPLGSYSNVTSPWGLFDVAGATTEWTESVLTFSDGRRFRIQEGSWMASDAGYGPADRIDVEAGAQYPSVTLPDYGLRIASIVPAPGACALGVLALFDAAGRRPRAVTGCGAISTGSEGCKAARASV